MSARNVAIRATPTILMISMAKAPLSIETKTQILFFGKGHPQWWLPETKYR